MGLGVRTVAVLAEHPREQGLDPGLGGVEALDGHCETLIDSGLLLVRCMLGVKQNRQASHQRLMLTEAFLRGVVHPSLLPRDRSVYPVVPRLVPRRAAHSSARTATHPHRRY